MASVKAFFDGLLSAVGKSATIFSHLNTAGDLFSLMRGRDLPANAGDAVKGMQGLLGQGDERRWQILMLQIESKEAGSRAIVEDFLEWHFLGKASKFAGFTAWIALDRFRTFVTKMGSGPESLDPDKYKVVTVEKRTLKTKFSETTTTMPFTREGPNNSCEFLLWMAQTIKGEPLQTADPKYQMGYEKLIRAFKIGNVPHTPESLITMAQKVSARAKALIPTAEQYAALRAKFRQEYHAASGYLQAKADDMDRRPRSWLSKLFHY